MKDTDPVEQPAINVASASTFAPLRPVRTFETSLTALKELAQAQSRDEVEGIVVTGVSLDSRSVMAGDLYVALPGAHVHGARFAQQAVANGARAILTDDAGAKLIAKDAAIPVLTSSDPRSYTGAVAALIYRTNDQDFENAANQAGGKRKKFELFAVTGTNGKTTTTYFLNSLLRALEKTTGLIGTIEILAGDQPVPSKLTTPESTEVHGLLALMRERGLDAASMEVSSHALAFARVDKVIFDVAGFTNLTQDHLDLHGDMEDYFRTKAALFTAEHAKRAIVAVDDQWGQKLAQTATIPLATLATRDEESGVLGFGAVTWRVHSITRSGIGNSFMLSGPAGAELSLRTGLPGHFNVSNAALATAMVAEQLLADAEEASAKKASLEWLQKALDQKDPFTLDVPGRMQLIGTAPVAVVDFAHNPDALERALDAVRSPEEGSRVIVVFGATGERDVTKRPIMGAIAARHADVVIVTDDDPHDEEPAGIRAGVIAGAVQVKAQENPSVVIEESDNRALAIRRAVELATPKDTILVAGRGHEVFQEVSGVNVALDDRVELGKALNACGFPVASTSRIEF